MGRPCAKSVLKLNKWGYSYQTCITEDTRLYLRRAPYWWFEWYSKKQHNSGTHQQHHERWRNTRTIQTCNQSSFAQCAIYSSKFQSVARKRLHHGKSVGCMRITRRRGLRECFALSKRNRNSRVWVPWTVLWVGMLGDGSLHQEYE